MILPGVGVASPQPVVASIQDVIWTDEIDLKVAGERAFNLPPAATIVFVDEVGFLCTARSGVIASEASAQWGVHGALAKYHAEESLADLTAANTTRVKFQTTLADAGETAPAVNVSVAATGAGTLKGRAYMKVTIIP